MPIQHAVLALLANGASHGYDLKSTFEASVGPQWGGVNIGHLYQVLERLVRDGLATRTHVAQNDRPDKAVYQISEAGRDELQRWLATPFVRQSGYRDDFFLKLFAASRLGPRWLHQVLAVQREAYLSELSALAELRMRHDQDSLVGLLIEAAVLHTEANLRVVELAEARQEALARSPGRQVDEPAELPAERQIRMI